MNQDEIIEMARQAGLRRFGPLNIDKELKAFAKLVAAKEREVCAQYAECHDLGTPDGHTIAKVIRARGEA